MEDIKILVVEDEEPIRKLIGKILLTQGMSVFQAANGSQCLGLMEKYDFDLIILDIMMGDISGYDVTKIIREQDIMTPIIFLSGKKEDEDIVKGLDVGADGYITKPFSPAVLCAQVKSQIKRKREILNKEAKTSILKRGPFTFDYASYRFFKDGVEIKLSSKETKLIKFFMENPHKVFSKEELYQNVWHETETDDNSIMVYIKYLRNKIEDVPSKPQYIKTLWGIGYEFDAD